MFTRQEIVKHPEYHLERIGNDLFNNLTDYLDENEMSKAEFATKAGLTERQVTTILNGNWRGNMKSFIKLCIDMNLQPVIEYNNLT